MNVSAERSRSLWMATAAQPFEAQALPSRDEADAVVIGSGIAGLSIAYELMAAGKSVIVLDRGPIARGMTARTTGHLTSVSDDMFWRLIDIHGRDGARAYYDSHAAAIDRIEQIAAAEEIACEFARVDGYLFEPMKPGSLAREWYALEMLGIETEQLAHAPIEAVETGQCLRFTRQGRFHPLLYLDGLANILSTRGVRLYADAAVTEIRESVQGVGVRTSEGATIRGRDCIIATNSPILTAPGVHEKQAPYRTYAFAAKVDSEQLEDALYWDTRDPYHYVRLGGVRDGSEHLIVGGEDHRSGEAGDMAERFTRLEAWARRHFPQMGEIAYRWSGQVMEPRDCIAFIGRKPGAKHTYLVTGDSGEGLTHGVVAGFIIRDLIVGAANPWADLYSPSRRRKAPARFHGEHPAHAATQKPPTVDSADALEPGSGGLADENGQKIATYRDENGALNQRSATCTHLGCTVQWNAFERCWDCPCHGSQFAPDGTVLNAPAVEPLGEVQAEVRAPEVSKRGREGVAPRP